jgi:SAM-dependent methyltransferase
MQAYSPAFARVYNSFWTGFAAQVGPAIREFYERQRGLDGDRSLLDIGCGTGQLALYFLEHAYDVTGIDLSEPMLVHARENAAEYVESGQATFTQGDASDFSLADSFGLVVSTYDALNHLENLAALERCFKCVYPVLEDGGYFVFDLNTRHGLRRWNTTRLQETDDALILTSGLYDEQGGRAWTRISGFMRTEGGLYERFEQTAFNTAFDLPEVREALLTCGWSTVHFAALHDLSQPLAEPENEERVFIVAHK